MAGKCDITSTRPTTAVSEASARIVTPASRIFAPPMPKKERCGLSRRASLTRLEPCRSPEASPATIMIRLFNKNLPYDVNHLVDLRLGHLRENGERHATGGNLFADR